MSFLYKSGTKPPTFARFAVVIGGLLGVPFAMAIFGNFVDTSPKAAAHNVAQSTLDEGAPHQTTIIEQSTTTPDQAILESYRKVLEAYAEFAFIKWCHDVREGYVYGAINDTELARAQTVVRSVVAQSTKVDANINTDKLWQMGLDLLKPRMDPRKVDQPGFSFVCHDTLRQLYELSPGPVYSIAKPR